MAKLLSFHPAKILIMAKTYPTPSSKYIETCCTAGITEDGKPVRIYPVPFRQLKDDKRYKKWQWIEAPIAQSDNDSRKESHKIQFENIKLGVTLGPANQWTQRIPWITKLPRYYDLGKLSEDGKNGTCSLAYMKVESLIKLEIKKADHSKHSKEDLEKLARNSFDLFSDHGDLQEIKEILQKIPYDFYYHFTINGKDQKAKIIDWEICQLYRRCSKEHPDCWEAKIQQKYFEQFKNFDRYLIMGNQNRFRYQFMIISVCAVPRKQKSLADERQMTFDL